MYPPASLARPAAMASAGTLELGAVSTRAFALAELPKALGDAARTRGLEGAPVTA